MKYKKESLNELKSRIPKNTLEEFYLKHNHKTTSQHFNITQSKLTALLKEYNITKTQQQINQQILQSKIDKYGNLENLNKQIKDKTRYTRIRNYGSIENYLKEHSQKIKDTNNSRTDTFQYKLKQIDKDEFINLYINQNKSRESIKEYFNVSEWVLDKIIDTFDCHKDKHNSAKLMLETKYNNAGSKEQYNKSMLEARNNTLINKYGSLENFRTQQSTKSQSMWNNRTDASRKTIIEKTRKTCQERYGLDMPCQLPQARCKGNNSKPNSDFAKLLDSYNIQYEREFVIENKSYDFKIDNILIEIDPTVTHNSTWSPFGKSNGKDKKYHFNKSETALKNGYRCIHIWDWDNKEQVIKTIIPRETIYARKCIIKEVDKPTSNIYLNTHHLQGKAKSNIQIGLFYNNELVSLMTFDKPRYNKNYQWELVRYCAHYNVLGGAEKLFKYFINTYNPQSIISYCDSSKFIGNTYSKLGFTYKKTSIGRHWYNLKTKQHITDNLLRQRGFDQLFNTNYGKGTSNEKLMLEYGFLDVYDSGQKVYEWINNEPTDK